ncbi:MAG: hypothetical protein HY270_10175 [Deltaproteobacteria bacterium]|nr:hypothetical protein [Deltaproteobacteria bacterium]
MSFRTTSIRGAVNILAIIAVVSLAGARPMFAICGDGIVDFGEQCDDGGTTVGGGCDPTCKLDQSGIACQRAIIREARKLTSTDATLHQTCLDHVANGKLACQATLCVLNPASGTPTTVTGSSCAVATDCCPAYDNKVPTSTTAAKITKAEDASAKAIKKACSLDKGPDTIKGTDDDTYIDPQTFGYASSCPSVAGCDTIATTGLASPGAANDYIDCNACLASGLTGNILRVHYPLAANSPEEVKCQRQVGLQARKETSNYTTLLLKCLDKVSNNALGCIAGQCTLNPLAHTPITVPSSSCSTAFDCCPNFDNVDAAKTTLTRIATAHAAVVTAVLKGCSTANGPDGLKGTSDDTYIDPQDLGYANTCTDLGGNCGTIATTDLSIAGADNDVTDCIQCTQDLIGVVLSHDVIR